MNFPTKELFPSLKEVCAQNGLDPEKLQLCFPGDDRLRLHIVDRTSVFVAAGEKAALWQVDSLRELFRGNCQPPASMKTPPDEYSPYFATFEAQVLTMGDIDGDLPDQEYELLYTQLRRRPDGKSLGVYHDALWQASALLLGLYPISQAMFEAILGRLARSAACFAIQPISRNYTDLVRRQFSGKL